MSKRTAEEQLPGQPPIKMVTFEPHLIGSVSTLEEMDIKVLKFQNKKLAQKIELRHRIEAELRQRIEQLEKRQTQDDAVLNVVNRYWNQLNEDIRVLLQRFDAETADESENKNENEATTSFLMQLSTWDKEELDDKLANRVQVSKRAVGKIIQAFDRLTQRNEKITMALKGELEGQESQPSLDETIRQVNIEVQNENRVLQALNTSLHEKYHTIHLKMAELQDSLNGKETENAELRNQIDELQYELEKIRCRNDKLETHLAEAIEKLKVMHQQQQQGGGSSSGSSGGSGNEKEGEKEKKTAQTTSVSQAKLDDLNKEIEEWKELANNRLQELDKIHQQHRESLKEVEKLKMDIRQLPESVIVETTEYKCLQSQFSVLYNELMQLKTQLDETKTQQQQSKNAHLRNIEMMESEELMAQKKLRQELMQLEDVLAQLRKEYEMLRIEFEQNLAANEQTGPINREMRHLITSLQNNTQQLKGEVHRYKRKYKEATAELVRVRKENEEFQNKIESLETQIQETKIKMEAQVREIKVENQHHENDQQNQLLLSNQQIKDEGGSSGNVTIKKEEGIKEENETNETNERDGCSPIKKEIVGNVKQEKPLPGGAIKKESGTSVQTSGGSSSLSTSSSIKNEKDPSQQHRTSSSSSLSSSSIEVQRAKESKAIESEIIRDLRAQLKKACNDQKEMKLLLDMYKGVSKDQRDKVQLMAAEKKLRVELDDLRMQLKKMQENKREDRKKLADEDALRKIKQLEEQKYELQKQVALQKPGDPNWPGHSRTFVGSHEEEALLNEMEVTGQAFEDMQEQNSRLIQQLREKDDANFKLMSERIKTNQINKLAREEKDVLKEQVSTLTAQVEATNLVVRKLEEKERILQNTLATVEKELQLRQQAMEMHKRKAIESAQSANDLKLHLEKYHAQMKEAQQVVAEKTSSLEAEAYKTKRLQEELGQLRRKADRMKRMEFTGSSLDEVMMEEIREYKETLTCPSCKVKRKDAVLTKCFHVFCWDCLRTRYETRQRKCPKCNCAFGANDYHRLYLST